MVKKYQNLYKITKKLTYLPENNRLLIFVILYSLKMKIRGTCFLKMCFDTAISKGIFVRENLKK